MKNCYFRYHYPSLADFFQYEKIRIKLKRRRSLSASQSSQMRNFLLTFENILDTIAPCKFNLHNILTNNRNDY